MEQFTSQLVTLLLVMILFGVSRGVYGIVYRSLTQTTGWRESGAALEAPGGGFARRPLSERTEEAQEE